MQQSFQMTSDKNNHGTQMLSAPRVVCMGVECVLHTDLHHRVGYLYNVYLVFYHSFLK